MQDGVHVSEGSLVSVEAKDETPERRTLQKKPSKLKTELALHSLGGAAARVTSKAGILIATMFAGDSDSDSEDENGLPKPKRIGRLRAGRDYIIGILQKYSIPLVFGVCLAMVWSNLDEESYLQMAHWTPIAGSLDQPMCLPDDLNRTVESNHSEDHHRRLGGGAGGDDFLPSDYNAKCSLEAVLKGWGIPTAPGAQDGYFLGLDVCHFDLRLLLAILDDALGMIIIAAYIVLAAPLSWIGLFKAHVHPALALVFIVPFMPATHAIAPQGPRDLGLDDGHPLTAELHVQTNFGMFFFGLVNAGVKQEPQRFAAIIGSIPSVESQHVSAWRTWAERVVDETKRAEGMEREWLVVGKTVGIAGMSLLGHCIGAPLPKGLSVPDLVATALGGVGLTVALFVANEAFVQPEMRGQAKMGAVLSISCGLLAFVIQRAFAKGKSDAEGEDEEENGVTSTIGLFAVDQGPLVGFRSKSHLEETLDIELQPEVQVAWLPVLNAFVKLQVFGIATVRRLLESKIDPNESCEPHGSTAVHQAATGGSGEVLRLLYDFGADLTARDGRMLTAAHLAADAGHVEVLRLLDELERRRCTARLLLATLPSWSFFRAWASTCWHLRRMERQRCTMQPKLDRTQCCASSLQAAVQSFCI
ncbi:unnamed protein product [Durusdinium trenchii]|uniref:Uncharacterized protein n=1 Tax=Durusdinium trenchii TaxID=1381693 RepID=A0ABP0NUH5_9DINO